jgi:interferon-induced GTP-binding protein Mx1
LRFSNLDARQQPQEEPEVFSDPQQLTRRLSEIHHGMELGGQRPSSRCRVIVRVFAPGVPDLTLVDLPGIVRTTTAGQSSRVIREVDEMIQEYIRMERTVILAVIPANQDIATVDVLERAHKVDPDGVRTIGILTKADLVSPGGEDETMAVLRNVRKPLRLGYVIVKVC